VFTFEERTTCILGRADDCEPRIPDDEAHHTVSRHHCLLDINPPDVRIRDFGSRNGTYVNGKKIGQREPGQTPEEALTGHYPEHDLSDDDEIRLGPVTIRIGVQQARDSSQDRNRVLLARPCACCGLQTEDLLDTAGGDGQNRICVSCREDPEAVARCLLKLARAGEPELGLLAKYDLVHELGRGGMGAVYLVRHVSTGEETALKLMLPKSAGTPKGRVRFLREATLASSLRHQNIVDSYGVLAAAGAYCYTSQYCPGGSLAQLLARSRGRVPVNQAIPLIIQVLDGLDHAHRSGVVHRDLSPGNILLGNTSDSAMVAKIGDFGLGKLFDQAGLSGLTQTGDAAGKPAYVPRQQVINFRYAKPAVDVWAAAACLYRMLTGTCPRDFPPGRDAWQVVLDDPAVPIRQRDPAVPADLADIIDWALHDDPEIGCQDAAELRDLLQGFPQY
jgi:hypothetical protein